ncbi:hypothetical protein [Janthinobacterium sp. RA13]|uniref:hypothetical protein n=1 Tax=Janthinobacterium sp. RA13 TaxID=1502762 RepID=UPI00126A278D|nr:hypothetical protein [Janthinobacterium sp. RA13]
MDQFGAQTITGGDMRDGYEEFGAGWLLIVGVIGFVLGFLLTKMKVLNDCNASKFATVSSGILAVLMALSADGVATGFIGWMGRVAIFVLMWFAGGIVFTLGVLLGREKADSQSKGK